MKKIMLYGGLAASAGFGAVYVSLYYAAMHPKAPAPAPEKHRIACVGDSITYGYDLMGAFRKYCYPTQLQDMLGDSYQVLNFGICDRTLQNGADKRQTSRGPVRKRRDGEPDRMRMQKLRRLALYLKKHKALSFSS